jgi:flagellar biosynthesis chaperone FliJ
MSLTLINKRSQAISLLLRKQEYEKDIQLKQYRATRAQQGMLNTQIDSLQAEVAKVKSALTAGKSLYVDEIIRLRNYLDQLQIDLGKLLVDLMKINGSCQKQLENLGKSRARTQALEKRKDDCSLEARKTLEKFFQNSMDESILAKHHRERPAEDME